MKNLIFTFAALSISASSLVADQHQKLLFTDDFERTESDDAKEEIGKGWQSNSAKRAGGNKQVDLNDGAMHIAMHETADHAVSVTHPMEFQNGAVELRFMLENKEDSLGLNFADSKFKEVHAGHLCMAVIGTSSIQLRDLKTGVMRKDIRTARKAKEELTAEQKAAMKDKNKRIPNKLKAGTWYQLRVTIKGDTMTLAIDDEEVGSFSSPGIAHPTKRTLRLAVPKKAVVDDIKLYAHDSE